MQAILEAPAQATPETQANFALDLVAIVCGVGVVMLVCLATYGSHMNVGFF